MKIIVAEKAETDQIEAGIVLPARQIGESGTDRR
jgi:hypothetical protein